MKPMKLNQVIKLLEQEGFSLIRSNGHTIYGKGGVRIALAHQRTVTPGVLRSVHKAIEQAKSESQQKEGIA